MRLINQKFRAHPTMCNVNKNKEVCSEACICDEGRQCRNQHCSLLLHIMAQQLEDVLIKAHLQIHVLAWESPCGPIKMCAHISCMGPLVMKLPKQLHGASIVSVMHF